MRVITIKDLNAVCTRINKLTNSPLIPYIDNKPQGGHYLIDQSCGGYSLHRMEPAGTGVRDVLSTGYVPARELYNALFAFIARVKKVSANSMAIYYIDHTDTFGGEANYCWVHRFKVEADSLKQALTKVKKEVYYQPLPRHLLSDYGDMLRADIGYEVFFVSEADESDLNHANIKSI